MYLKGKKIKLLFVLSLAVLIFFIYFNFTSKRYKGVNFENGKVYILYRETNSKVGEIAKNYNLKKSNYSHVGIGYIKDDHFKVFHILPSKDMRNNTELLIQSVNEFYNPNDDIVKSGSIYVVNTITENEFLKIIKLSDSLSHLTLRFDNKFSSKEDNKFYCSELVYFFLQKTNKNRFYEELTVKKMSAFESTFIGCDTLKYYPVDMYIGNKNFTCLSKW